MASLWEQTKPRHALPRHSTHLSLFLTIFVVVIALVAAVVTAKPVHADGGDTIALSSDQISQMTVDTCAGGFDWCENSGTWNPVTDNAPVNRNSVLRFQLGFTVPKGTLTNARHIFTYQMPDSVKRAQPINSYIVSTSGKKMATFSINANGLITINFNGNGISANSRSDLPCDLNYFINASDLGTNDQGQVSIPYGNDKSIILKTPSDLEVSKSSSYQQSDKHGKITYTLTVSSMYGTNPKDHLTISDHITRNAVPVAINSGSVTITPKPGNWNSTGNITMDGETGFSVTNLPPLHSHQSYAITYTAKASVPQTDTAWTALDDTASIHNEASASTTGYDHKPLKGSGQADVTFTHQKPVKPTAHVILSKKGSVDKTSKKIDWTITLNTHGVDVSGQILNDWLNKDYEWGTVLPNTPATISPNPSNGKGSSSISFTNGEYTFPAGTQQGTYTITYSTKAPKSANSVSNTVAYNNKYQCNGGTGCAVSKVDVTSIYPPSLLKKQGTGHRGYIAADSQGNKHAYYILGWKASMTGLTTSSSKWAMTDKLENTATLKQWFSPNQQTAFVHQLRFSQPEVEISFSGFNADGYPTSFTISGKKPLSDVWSGFHYESTGMIVGRPGQTEDFRNSVFLDDVNNSEAENIIKPPSKTTITKQDPSATDSKESSHNADQLKTVTVSRNSQNIRTVLIPWVVTVNATIQDRQSPLVIAEHLPTGLSLYKVGIRSADGATENDSSTITIAGKSYTLALQKGTDGDRIILPAGWPAEKTKINVYAQINKWEWMAQKKDYAVKADNSVSLYHGNESGTPTGKPLGTDHQTQTITKPDDTVNKSGQQNSGDNIVTYKLTVNPAGQTLLGNDKNNKLTLFDNLSYQSTNGNHYQSATLIPGSVTITDSNGKKVESSYTQNTTKTSLGSGSSQDKNIQNELTINNLPDATPLTITYQYQLLHINNSSSASSYTISNSAELEGHYVNLANEKFEDRAAQGHTHLDTINLVKMDKDNNALLLHGASFNLFKYSCNSAAGGKTTGCAWDSIEWPTDQDTTDSNGQLTLPKLEPQVLYKLTEKTAPDGYEIDKTPRYFYMTGQTASLPPNIPSEVKRDAITMFNPGGELDFTDTKHHSVTQLPFAGGLGLTDNWLFMGGILAALAVAAFSIAAKKQRRRIS